MSSTPDTDTVRPPFRKWPKARSICTQKAELHAYGPESAFRFTKGAFDEATGYAWGRKTTIRFFCPTCGCQLLWRGMGRVGVNVRTFDGIDVDKLELQHVDGKSF
ncbi:hypothetical protein DFH11DRAFT_1543527 [Phellopilus nigrolimitatus]|nr:hypothetical protein DFH11DRAFT_1543527 [Phellopilus nigrolimitatus]